MMNSHLDGITGGSDSRTRRRFEELDIQSLQQLQLDRLNRLLSSILPQNGFYAEKLRGIELPLASLSDIGEFPFTRKDELVVDAAADALAANRTWPRERYVRFHRTSGTRGRAVGVLDTAEDWQWWIDTWQFVLDAAELVSNDRVLMAFSFGPFVGFWSAYDAVAARGALVIPTGGMSTRARIELALEQNATVVGCTPSYALHMADVAAKHQIILADADVRCLIVAGEPGGSIPEVRRRIEADWGARVVDHGGATEVGPWGYADQAGRGLHIVESEFIAEFISVESGRAAADGELSELVLTSLRRFGCPVIRYRTGDLVRPRRDSAGPNRFVLLEGGVLGRTDDMMVIRGVNIFPSSVESILRGFADVVEFRMTASKSGQMDMLRVEIEDRRDRPQRVAEELRLKLGLTVQVDSVPVGSLPRSEGKSRRFVDLRE